ncbi:ubiquinone/menaquinone biosynthesis C-methylase UbiE [Rhizobium sp. BK313]|uniref:class I SAM-dependent methyltransferase n=1 Tax=Rhizobium sp. BK313 TaxID=2587081 RepID=UPI00105D214E|nr:methyltransferase domain-containing protein [Rhizobium sp. BK313]MBB3453455.1 ubiquinone/menaquinone biosynthesis C-methylase UbiE [Rhizobium sp. BK313]
MTEACINTYSPRQLHAKAWAEEYELIDRQLSPLGLRAMEELRLGPMDTVIDVGCGTGQTILQLADRVGEEGLVYGVDIAEQLLSVAGQRTSHRKCVRLIEADAQVVELPSRSVDAVFSRFGVMSLRDPIAAFSNFHRSLKRDGRIAFCCWGPFLDNELDRFPLLAAGFQSPEDETPFSFSDPEYVRNVLMSAGFKDIAMVPYDEAVTSGDVDAMTRVLLSVGPLGKIARENPAIKSAAEPKLREALAGLGHAASVALVASIWIVTARA